MAAVNPTFRYVGNHTVVATWLDIPEDETGSPIGEAHADYSDRTVQIGGTLGGATVTIEGSNDGVTYFTLNDPQTAAISKTGAAMETIMESPLYLRPKVAGGTGSTVHVYLVMRRIRGDGV